MSIRVEFHAEAFYELRRDPAVIGECEAIAGQVADRAATIGKGSYAVGSRQGMRRPQGRWRATVITADHQAIRDNARNHTLARAIGGS